MSPSPASVAVTGATGRLGGRVARRLAAAGVPRRLLVRDLARAPQLPDATAARAPYADADAGAAADAGIGHLVSVSFYGAAPDATGTLARDHWATEQHIHDRGLPTTFLRDNLYLDFLPAPVGTDGVIRATAVRAASPRSPRTTSPTPVSPCCGIRAGTPAGPRSSAGPRRSASPRSPPA